MDRRVGGVVVDVGAVVAAAEAPLLTIPRRCSALAAGARPA